MPAASTRESLQVEEIIVTARRTSERLQDVPVAVTAVSAQDLESFNITGVAGLNSSVPNATFYARGGSSSSASVYIRGVGQADDLFMFDSGVGIYVDDVYIGRVQAALFELIDIDRVEVLRGPQGSLYGKNTSGGAVKLLTRRPDLDDASARVELTGGNYDLRSAKLTANVPLVTDRLALRANVLRVDRGGYVDDVFDGRELQTRDFIGGQVSLLAQPTQDLTAWLSFDTMQDDSIPAAPTPITDFSYAPIGSFSALPPRQTSSGQPLFYDQRNWGVNGTVDWTLPSVTLKSITAYRRLNFHNYLDYLGTPFNLISAEQTQTSDQRSQEFQATFQLGERAELLTGLYYMDERSDTDYVIPNTIVVPIAPGAALGLPNTSLYGAALQTVSYAAFTHLVYEMTPRLSMSAGLRYSHDEKEYQAALGNDVFPSANFGYQLKDEWDRWLPKLSFDYKLDDERMLYLSYATGFRSGGFNPRATSAFFGQKYDPETNDTYEVGLKSTFFERMLTLNAAVFYNTYDDFQTNIRILDPDTGLYSGLFANTGKYESYGVELEAVVRPSSALKLSGQISYLDNKFDSFDTGLFGNLKDKKLPNAPKWNAALFASYLLGAGEYGDFEFAADIAYRDDTYTALDNNPVFEREAHTLVNARIAFTTSSGAWTAFVAGRNLTDETVLLDGANLSSAYFADAMYYQEPRTYMVGLRYQFGTDR